MFVLCVKKGWSPSIAYFYLWLKICGIYQHLDLQPDILIEETEEQGLDTETLFSIYSVRSGAVLHPC